MKFLILNGANLNLQGRRDTACYGCETFDELMTRLCGIYAERQEGQQGVKLHYFQSNIEGELVDALHQAESQGFDGVVFNAGGYTHTSVVLRDAVDAIALPVVELHISNVAGREEFRHVSLLTPVVDGLIMGFGMDGYKLAVEALIMKVSARSDR